jgi:hypothetical protein
MNRVISGLEVHSGDVELGLDYLLNIVESARFAEFLRGVDAEMKQHLAMTIQEWKSLSTAALQYRRGQRLLSRYWLPVEFLIGGVVRGSGCVVSFGHDGKPYADQLACIGTGGSAAYRQLMRRSQHVYMSIPRTLLHIAEAMREAELDQPATVGPPSDYVVLTKKQTRRMPANDPTLQRMLEKYADLDTEEIDGDDIAFNAIQAAMYLPGIFKEEYERGMRDPRQRTKPSGSQT